MRIRLLLFGLVATALVSLALVGALYLFVALMGCLAFLGLVVVPLGAFSALRRERIEQTFDLITLTALSSRRVVVGKLMAQGVRLTTLFAAMAPFVAMSFLLGGIDFVTIAISLVVLLMASLWVCALCVFLSALVRSRALSSVIFVAVGIAILFAAGVAGSAFRALTLGVFFGVSGGPSLTTSQIFWTLAIVTTAWLVTLVNLVLLAVNRLSLPTEDSVTSLRLGFLAQLLLMAGALFSFRRVRARSVGRPTPHATGGIRRHRKPDRSEARAAAHEVIVARGLGCQGVRSGRRPGPRQPDPAVGPPGECAGAIPNR
jgi:hypothetical protein